MRQSPWKNQRTELMSTRRAATGYLRPDSVLQSSNLALVQSRPKAVRRTGSSADCCAGCRAGCGSSSQGESSSRASWMNIRLHSGLTRPRSSTAREKGSWYHARSFCSAVKLLYMAVQDVGCWIDEGGGGDDSVGDDGRGGGGDGDDGGAAVGDKETARARRAASRSLHVTSRTKARMALVAGLGRAALSLARLAVGVVTIGGVIGGVAE